MEQFVRLFQNTVVILLYVLVILQQGRCDWVSEWLTPLEMQRVEDQSLQGRTQDIVEFLETTTRNNNVQSDVPKKEFPLLEPVRDLSMNSLKTKLESTLQSAEELAKELKKRIIELEAKERILKDAIVHGKSGVTTLTVSGEDKSSRSYIIRDGYWTLCSGMIQNPISAPSFNIFNEIFSSPRCIGQEIPSVHDSCAFNSIIKYETLPTARRSIYKEDDFLCLKTNFNSSMEHYSSVSKTVVKDTCQRGTIKTLTENIASCGERILLEYTYYPNGNYLAVDLPLEYCTAEDGSCKLIVAWYLSNTTIENFDILSDDKKFKKTFMKTVSANELTL